MAFDAGMVAAITKELRDRLTLARIEKVHQPEKDEILLLLHSGRDNLRLTISASANNPRIHLTDEIKENPSVPPMFCILLRKHLSGGKILDVEQMGFERVIRIRIESKDDMGYFSEKRLYAEIMGKYSNLILTDGEDRILGAIRPVDFTTSAKRQVLPGMRYELPPAQDKANPLTETKEGFFARLEGFEPSFRTDKFITANYQGISATVAREIAFTTGENLSCGKNLLWNAFSRLVGRILSGDFEPCLVVDENDHPTEYCFFEIFQYGAGYHCVRMNSFSELIEKFFASRDQSDRVRQRAGDLLKLIHNAKSRLEKKSDAQREELTEAGKKDEYRRMGDLITGEMYRLKRGMDFAMLTDYADEAMPLVRVELDPRLSPAANAQRYYKKYNKAKNAEEILSVQLAESEAEIAYLDSVLDSLSRAKGQSELDEIRTELSGAGYGSRMRKNPGGAKKTPSKPLTFRTTGGYRLLCGKNNVQNEQISFKIAGKGDWWFHVKNAPGSHVVLLCDGEEPSERDFTEAAMIAAYHSSLAQAKNIAVDYTQIRNLKKPAGAKPGFVIYHTNYSAYVTPDPALCERLREE
ncbi:MAG: NFACT family protein [Eubacteriales bacterium]